MNITNNTQNKMLVLVGDANEPEPYLTQVLLPKQSQNFPTGNRIVINEV